MQAVSQKRHTVLAKLELPHFIETVFVQVCKVGVCDMTIFDRGRQNCLHDLLEEIS